MLVPGLVSVTFRSLGVPEIVDLAAANGLSAVHWGGDVHVPVGAFDRAVDARVRCADAGLEVEAYGSYYRAGDTDPGEFARVVATAEELGAPAIRVWAGVAGSAEVDSERRAAVVDDLRRCGEVAAARGIRVVVEYHPGTLTDDPGSARRLFDELDPAEVRSYWQPGAEPDPAVSVREIEALSDRIDGAHVFSWGPGGFHDRLPLAERADHWVPVLDRLAGGPRRHVLLEFVRDDSPAAFARDAATLLEWLR
ncbi:sugar phosphate isomerase/epimerase family protein [Actinoalloteichus caeruleus]|uniref:sugar phosphate isomerase/epimerase family protein n=1 Tax=Actinoalloteichus cyanogriseus TaxID=2893586 RepID=UPI0004C0F65D|nr:TIM barrel protein [Actinoalloteichus caeruleus]